MNHRKTAIQYEELRFQGTRLHAGTRCARCGRTDDLHSFGDLTLCTDCYYIYGSCCMEFGADDLTQPD